MKVRQERGAFGLIVKWTAAAVTAGATAWAVRDYARWRSLGPGGLPANVRGWFTMTRFRFIAKDELDVSPLVAASGTGDDLRAWTKVRRRLGKRPTVSPYPVPHRQVDQLPGEVVRLQLRQLFDDAVRKHAGQVEYALSQFEKRHAAITLKEAGRRATRFHGEIAHIHPSDNSMHMILSPGDAVAAIERGWAQRHGLAGIAGLPPTYVLVYSPRNDADLTGIGELLEAAIAYATRSL